MADVIMCQGRMAWGSLTVPTSYCTPLMYTHGMSVWSLKEFTLYYNYWLPWQLTPNHCRVVLTSRPMAICSAPVWKMLFFHSNNPCNVSLCCKAWPNLSAASSLIWLWLGGHLIENNNNLSVNYYYYVDCSSHVTTLTIQTEHTNHWPICLVFDKFVLLYFSIDAQPQHKPLWFHF